MKIQSTPDTRTICAKSRKAARRRARAMARRESKCTAGGHGTGAIPGSKSLLAIVFSSTRKRGEIFRITVILSRRARGIWAVGAFDAIPRPDPSPSSRLRMTMSPHLYGLRDVIAVRVLVGFHENAVVDVEVVGGGVTTALRAHGEVI